MVKFGEGDDTYQQVKSFLLDLSQDTDSRSSDHSIWKPSPALQTSLPNTRDLTQGCIVNPTAAAPDQKRHKSISTVPFSKDPIFVGRQDILARLDSQFADPKSQGWASLYGLGGIGLRLTSLKPEFLRVPLTRWKQIANRHRILVSTKRAVFSNFHLLDPCQQ